MLMKLTPEEEKQHIFVQAKRRKTETARKGSGECKEAEADHR